MLFEAKFYTFAVWKGARFESSFNSLIDELHTTPVVCKAPVYARNIGEKYKNCFVRAKKLILYSVAEVSSSIDPEKEANEEFKRMKNLPL